MLITWGANGCAEAASVLARAGRFAGRGEGGLGWPAGGLGWGGGGLGRAEGGLGWGDETATAAGGVLASTAAGWLLNARAATATSQLAALWMPSSRSLGARRPRSAA